MAPTRLPSTIRIGGHVWAIITDADEWKKEPKHDEAHAITDTDHMRILLAPELHERHIAKVKAVVLHEVLHACFDMTGADLIMKDEDTAEESYIQVTAPMLLNVFRDNPKFVAWLQEA